MSDLEAEYAAAGLVIHRYEHGGGRVYFERGKSRDLVMDLYDEDNAGKRRDAIIAAVLASGVLRALRQTGEEG